MPLSKLTRKLLLSENLSLKFRKCQIRTCWVDDVNLSRNTSGEFQLLYKELRKDDEKFCSYLRMKQETFDLLLDKLKDTLQKEDTNFRCSITPEEQLVVTLRYLATGDSFRSLASHFLMGRSTIANIIKGTCEAIWNCLQCEYIPWPTTEKWYEISQSFYEQWNFPNCLGAIDGKHIRVICHDQSGTLYHNNKQYFSILLQALVDSNGKLIFVDVETEDLQYNSGNFKSSSLFRSLETKQLNIPEDKEIPGTDIKIPYVIVGDAGYPLLNNLMRPFGQRNLDNDKRIYNYRLSRARRSVECCFGTMAQKWRILLKPIATNIQTALHVIKAICILHNFVMTHEHVSFEYINNESNDTLTLISNRSQRTQHRFTSNALQTRENLMNYFNRVGAVPWQNNYGLPENILERENAS